MIGRYLTRHWDDPPKGFRNAPRPQERHYGPTAREQWQRYYRAIRLQYNHDREGNIVGRPHEHLGVIGNAFRANASVWQCLRVIRFVVDHPRDMKFVVQGVRVVSPRDCMTSTRIMVGNTTPIRNRVNITLELSRYENGTHFIHAYGTIGNEQRLWFARGCLHAQCLAAALRTIADRVGDTGRLVYFLNVCRAEGIPRPEHGWDGKYDKGE